MVNKQLETFIFKCSTVLFVLFATVVVLLLDHKLQNLGAAVGGYALSCFLFEATAMLYGRATTESKARVLFSAGVLVSAFLVMLVALYMVMKVSMQSFWVLFGGIVTIPAFIMVYIVLEAAGVLHTNFYT